MPEVHVFMAAGKIDEQKKNMMVDITNALVQNLDCAAESVTVQIIEARWSHKMKGGQTFEERRTNKTPSTDQLVSAEPAVTAPESEASGDAK